jgi:hypothetical protein
MHCPSKRTWHSIKREVKVVVVDPQHNEGAISEHNGIPITKEAFEQLINVESPYRYELYRRATDWKQEQFLADQIVTLDQLDLRLPLATIYEGLL